MDNKNSQNLENNKKFQKLNKNLKIEIASYLFHNEIMHSYMNLNKKIRSEMNITWINSLKVTRYLGYLKNNSFDRKGFFNLLADNYSINAVLVRKFSKYSFEEILKGFEIYIYESISCQKMKKLRILLDMSNSEEIFFFSQLLDSSELVKDYILFCFENVSGNEHNFFILKKIKHIKIYWLTSAEEEEFMNCIFNYLEQNRLKVTFHKLCSVEIYPSIMAYFRLFPNQLQNLNTQVDLPSNELYELLSLNLLSLKTVNLDDESINNLEILTEGMEHKLNSLNHTEETLEGILSKTFIKKKLIMTTIKLFDDNLMKEVEMNKYNLHKCYKFLIGLNTENNMLMKTVKQFNNMNLVRLFLNFEVLNHRNWKKLPSLLTKFPLLEKIVIEDPFHTPHRKFKLENVFIIQMWIEFPLDTEWFILIHQLLERKTRKNHILEFALENCLKYFRNFVKFTFLHHPLFLQNYQFYLDVLGDVEEEVIIKDVKINQLYLAKNKILKNFIKMQEVKTLIICQAVNIMEEKFKKFIKEKKVKFLRLSKTETVPIEAKIPSLDFLRSIIVIDFGEVESKTFSTEFISAVAELENIQYIEFTVKGKDIPLEAEIKNHPKIKINIS